MDLDFSNLVKSTKPKTQWTPQQEAIFEAAKNENSGNIVVTARAGSGKTTTIIECIKFVPEKSVLVVAFNKVIEQHMTERLPVVPNKTRQAKTLHSLGFQLCKNRNRWVQIAKGSSIAYEKAAHALECWKSVGANGADTEAIHYIQQNFWLPVKLASVVKSMAPFSKTVDEAMEVMEEMSLDICPERKMPKRNGVDEWAHLNDVVCEIVNIMLEKTAENANNTRGRRGPLEVDFDDMCWLPVRCGWLTPVFDMVVADEAQDLSKVQLLLAVGVCKGRMMIVGDPMQAIYGFRGADSGAIARMTEELKATELKLTWTFRCPKLVVDMVNKYVPDFHAMPSAPDGLIKRLTVDQMIDMLGPNDFVLSRVNAPLMSICLKLIVKGKRATMAGKEIGDKLVAIFKKVEGKRKIQTCEDLWARLQVWAKDEKDDIAEAVHRKRKNSKQKNIDKDIKQRCEFVDDQVGVFHALIRQIGVVSQVKAKLETLFSDPNIEKSDYIVCSSVHKAKGLERERVFVLFDTLKTSDQEEINIWYVALTRVQKSLFLVLEDIGTKGYQKENDDLDEYDGNVGYQHEHDYDESEREEENVNEDDFSWI